GVLGGTFWSHDLDFQAIGVVVGQVSFYFFNQLRIVCTLGIQPEDRRSLRCTGAGNGQFDPVADRNIFGLDCAPDVTGFNLVAHQHVACRVDDFHGAV